MWSHDGFTTDDNGYNWPNKGSHYCDQNKAWELFGNGILEKAWKGLNVTMFAYGQTGAGKSYTMFGYGANKGVVPMAADKLFERIRSNKDPDVTFQVTVYMVEIYMEKLQDLLIDKTKRGTAGLQIREKNKQVYVDGVTKKFVNSYEAIQQWLDFGDKQRTIGETQMNKTSSRAHTIFTIELVTVTDTQGKKS